MPARATWARSPLPKRYILQLHARRIRPGDTWWSFRSGGVSWAGASWRFVHSALAHRSAHPCLGLPYRPLPVHSACCPDGHAAVVNIHRLSHLHACGKILTGLRCSSQQSSFGHIGALPFTHALPDAAPGPSWCWARPACSIPITSAALLLPALALFHLFFVRKERRWWQPVTIARPGRTARPATSSRSAQWH